jgi:3-mercaptopyruvate sulfurtransferase SseA
MTAMDIRITDTIICYDFLGMLAAPRVSWMLRAFGAKSVFVLDGSESQWKEEGLVTTG